MQKYDGKDLALVIFESIMAVFYLVAGVSLLVWERAEVLIQFKTIRIIVGVVILLYGIFRVYRAIRKIF